MTLADEFVGKDCYFSPESTKTAGWIKERQMMETWLGLLKQTKNFLGCKLKCFWRYKITTAFLNRIFFSVENILGVIIDQLIQVNIWRIMYLNCGIKIYTERSSQSWRQLRQLRKWTGFEPMTSPIPVQSSTSWSEFAIYP